MWSRNEDKENNHRNEVMWYVKSEDSFYSFIVIMFLIFFLIFILIFTIFENILLAGIFLVLVIIWLTIYQLISGKKILSRQILLSLFGACVLAGLAFGIKEIRYYGKIEIWIPAASPGGKITPEWDNGVWKNGNMENKRNFVGSGIISDISGQGKYVFEIENNEYLLYSEKEYRIGDVIWLVGSMDSGQIPAAKLNAGMRGRKYRKITSWTFAVPLFSWAFDYPKWLKMKGRKGTIYEKNSIKNGKMEKWKYGFRLQSGTPEWGNWVWIIQSMKKSIQEKVIDAYGKNKISGLVLGMLIGDKSQIPEKEYEQFVDSGLVHLIAVSGWNILMIVVFLQCILFFLPFYVRIACILVTITGYSLICGMDSSVFRALLMGWLSMVALFWGREINIWRLLSISAIIMLLINPYFLVYDTGFLLSYSAIIGLIYFQNNDKWEMKDDKWQPNRLQKTLQYIYKNYISPSIWASIGIFPIIIFFMGKINLLSIIGNLFVLPIVPFVMIYGFISIYLHQFLGWSRLLWIEKICVEYIYKISELLSMYGVFLKVSWLWMKYLLLVMFLAGFVWWRLKDWKEEKGET